MLDRALPVILAEDADFKITAALERLEMLNAGRGGRAQVGKFITVYPTADEQAVRLAAALDRATRGLRGPLIPSDRALHPQSLVHYRYGGFGAIEIQTPIGEILPAITAPDGSLIPDRRVTNYVAPPWAADPFVAAGIADAAPPGVRRFGDRYVTVAEIHSSPRSRIWLCLDVEGPRCCVVKRVADDGNGGAERLRHEADVLATLAGNPRFPGLIELIADEAALCLVMEDIDGRTLDQHLVLLRHRNALPSPQQLVRWGQAVADMLEAIHAEGLIYRDLKASNVIVDSSGELHLVDFELAARRGDDPEGPVAPSRGTQGYMSPQQQAGEAPAVADDVYSFGALLYLIATGAEPSFAPYPARLLDRPVELLNADLGPGLAAVIARCLDPDPQRRPTTPADAAAELRAALETRRRRSSTRAQPGSGDREDALRLARRIADSLCERFQRSVVAARKDHLGEERWTLDVNTGAAGAIIALSELVEEFGDRTHRSALSRGAHWLIDAPRPAGLRPAGLYVGEAGIAAAVLRAGQVLEDATLIDAAASAGRAVAAADHSSPDLFNGTAGRVRLHLWLWHATQDPQHLRDACGAGEHLLAAGDLRGGEPTWQIPAGYDSLSGRRMTGYAHGAAGIADVLLDLFEATAQTELLEVACAVGRWLEDLATPVLGDDSGRNWPGEPGGQPTMAFWCHGAAGIARFLLRLWGATQRTEVLELAGRAARTVVRGTRWSGVTQCHGLAGNIECLLDFFQATRDEAYLSGAETLSRIMRAFVLSRDDRLHVVTDLDRSDAGFTAGAGGVAACLIRLAHPATRPHLMSLRGFVRHDSSAWPSGAGGRGGQ